MSLNVVLWLKEPWMGHSVVAGECEVATDPNTYEQAFTFSREFDGLIFPTKVVGVASFVKGPQEGCPFPVIDPSVAILNGPDCNTPYPGMQNQSAPNPVPPV